MATLHPRVFHPDWPGHSDQEPGVCPSGNYFVHAGAPKRLYSGGLWAVHDVCYVSRRVFVLSGTSEIVGIVSFEVAGGQRGVV